MLVATIQPNYAHSDNSKRFQNFYHSPTIQDGEATRLVHIFLTCQPFILSGLRAVLCDRHQHHTQSEAEDIMI